MKKTPQRKNKNAGKFTGESESSKYFSQNPKARKKKNEYNTEYHSTDERKKYRAKLNKENRENPIPKGYDKSHTKNGKIVNEKASTNRARNGKNGSSTKK